MAKAREKATWPRDTTKHANAVGTDFKDNLKGVAQHFADHEQVDSVSRKHVDAAFSALSLLGLRTKGFWQRSDTWTALGGFLFGFAFAMPDACTLVGDFFGATEDDTNTVATILLIVLAVLGALIFFWSRYRGSLPSKPGTV